ncbi:MULTISPECIES: gamma-glutamylcyclotransferase family protein [unclassified Pseudomonas]|uniref:gamma-glutamylcyclotransferase family protein n=1 Tax=unclassified Pseudomonas TaxID=196821 RepID=UPI000DAC6DAA|nr:gamma-glutamylcyclotransferase family protein [Pseudomonas sp. URMO17WK12:I6]PZW52990.1 gamma-glutamyl AIG2-like cyclotransferase [Pseudomonas sp. URMO17WK12:I6]
MPNQTEQLVLLFSYGTLQDRAVQLSTFGRELKGRLDSLPGYKQNLVEITDPAVLAASGKSHHPIVQESGDLSDEIAGTVFEITAQELVAADEYEVADYKRVSVPLKSGISAWVYVRA